MAVKTSGPRDLRGHAGPRAATTDELGQQALALALTVVVPAYDEALRLHRCISALGQQLDPQTTELLVVDDGSEDDTAGVAQELLRSWPHGRLIRNPVNLGKGGAVRAGVMASRGEHVLFVDADAATDADCLHDLLDGLATADVVIGSRAVDGAVVAHSQRHRALMGQLFNRLVRTATSLEVRDTQCGFKAFRAPVAKLVFSMSRLDGFAFDVEILHLAQQLGLRVAEVPVRWRHVDGSKIRHLRDSAAMAVDTLRAARAPHPEPVTCLRLAPSGTTDVTDALAALPTDALLSYDRGTVDVVLPPGAERSAATVMATLAAHGGEVEQVVLSGDELLARSRFGRLSVGLPMAPVEPAPDGPARARSSAATARRALRRAKYLMGHHPATLPVLLRCTPLGTSRRITADTQLVVEGFPRAGNTFVVGALLDAARQGLSIKSHVHHPAQIKDAVRRGVPVLLLVRRPLPTLASYLIAGPHATPAGVLDEYIRYHRELLPFLRDIEVADFDEATTDMGALIRRLNERFDLSIPEFDETPPAVARTFAALDEAENRSDHNRRHRLALRDPALAARLAEAEHLHGLLLDLR